MVWGDRARKGPDLPDNGLSSKDTVGGSFRARHHDVSEPGEAQGNPELPGVTDLNVHIALLRPAGNIDADPEVVLRPE